MEPPGPYFPAQPHRVSATEQDVGAGHQLTRRTPRLGPVPCHPGQRSGEETPRHLVAVGTGGADARGSQRQREYDTLSGRYAEFIEKDVPAQSSSASTCAS